jgi:hypothetical protein
MFNLFLDDIRKPLDLKQAWHRGTWEEFPTLFAWEIVRSYQQFVDYILKHGLPKRISFDHDLSWEHYPQTETDYIAPINYNRFNEKTGYDAAKWLCGYCETNSFDLPEFYVHSFNPVGRKNIIDHLVRFQQHLDERKKQS